MGERKIAALIVSGGPEGISLIVPYQKTGILIEGVNFGETVPQWSGDPLEGVLWADPFKKATPDELETYGELSHILYDGDAAKKRIEKLIEEIKEDDHEGTV